MASLATARTTVDKSGDRAKVGDGGLGVVNKLMSGGTRSAWVCAASGEVTIAAEMPFGDSSLISTIGGLVGQGAGQVEILSRDVPMDGRSL